MNVIVRQIYHSQMKMVMYFIEVGIKKTTNCVKNVTHLVLLVLDQAMNNVQKNVQQIKYLK